MPFDQFLPPSAEIWIKYIYNICIIYIMSSNSYWTLLMPTSILQGFAHFCPFLKGFFQHPASTTSTQPGWFDHGEKKPRSQWWSMHGTQFAMGLGGSCTKTLDFRKDELGTLGYQEVDGSLKNVSISFVRDSVLGVYTIGLTMCLFWFRFQYLSLYCVLGMLS